MDREIQEVAQALVDSGAYGWSEAMAIATQQVTEAMELSTVEPLDFEGMADEFFDDELEYTPAEGQDEAA